MCAERLSHVAHIRDAYPCTKIGTRRSRRRAYHVAAVVPLVAIVMVFALPLMSALASAPPQFRGELDEEQVYASRAHIEVTVLVASTEEPEAKWRGEYAPAEQNGEAPPAKSPLWTAAGGGTTRASSISISLGDEDPAVETTILHHLTPSTTYYARFHVENEAHEKAEETYKFITTGATKPEVASALLGQSSFKLSALTPTSAGFTAQIEANGAESKYSFEYATSEAGPWLPFSSGAIGSVSVAEDFLTRRRG